jgi:MATE family multidrug resistance protein
MPSTAAPAPRSELRALVGLAVPLALVQVGMMAMGFVDTVMAGRVSAPVLAAVALANLYFSNVAVFALGTLMGLDPLVAQALGANDRVSAKRAVQRALALMVVLSVALALALVPARQVLELFGQPREIIDDATAYLWISIPGTLPYLAFFVFRQSLQAMHRAAPIVWTIVGANLLNVFLNWVFLFGHLGSPAMGAEGGALATTIARWAMAGALLALGWRDLKPMLLPLDPTARTGRALRSMFSVGFPIGLQQGVEVCAFGAIGLMMGHIGMAEIASHQVAITLAAMTFMVPLGIGAAAAVRVGHAVGARDPARVRAAIRAAFACGLAFMCITALVFRMMPRQLAMLMTPDPAVIALASVLIPIAGVFQVFDGAQAVGAGILRGIGDTRVPLGAMLVGYWVLGIPVSAWLAFNAGLGAAGLWWGFVVSLAAVAVFLVLRITVLLKRAF